MKIVTPKLEVCAQCAMDRGEGTGIIDDTGQPVDWSDPRMPSVWVKRAFNWLACPAFPPFFLFNNKCDVPVSCPFLLQHMPSGVDNGSTKS